MRMETGTVTAVDYKKGTVKVLFNASGDVIDGLCVVTDYTNHLPEKGSEVLVLFDESKLGRGYVVGSFFDGTKKPKRAKKGSIEINQNVTIKGTLKVSKTITQNGKGGTD